MVWQMLWLTIVIIIYAAWMNYRLSLILDELRKLNKKQ